MTKKTPGLEPTAEIEALRARLAEAEEVLRAIHYGEVDAVVVTGWRGEQVYALAGADSVYRQLVEQMGEGAATLSAEGVLLYCNAGLTKMMERPLDRLLGENLRGFLPPAEQKELDAILKQAGAGPCRREILLKTGGGSLIPVHLSVSCLQREGEELMFSLLFMDLTGEKKFAAERQNSAELAAANKELAFQNEEKAKRAAELAVANKKLAFQNKEKIRRAEELTLANSYLNNLIGYANAPIIVWDAELRITRFNRAFEVLAGRCESGVLGKTPEFLFPPAQAERSMELVKSALKGERLETAEIDILSANGAVRTVLWNTATIFRTDGKTPLAAIAQGQDITSRRQAMAELEQSVESLREKNEEIEHFLYTASHDLKTPLVTIRSFLGHLKKDLASANSGLVSADMDFIRAAADKMWLLLNNLLGIARIGRIVSPPAHVTLRKLADEALAMLAAQLAARGARVRVCGGEAALYGDPVRLAEIWQNLIGNSCKYMGGQKEPDIEIGAETRKDELVFYVRDNGIGIDPRFQSKIFGLFEKLDAKSEGSGIGLAIVKRIVTLFGGRIWVESAGPGLGSCFYFTLPKAAGEPKEGEKIWIANRS